MKHIFLSLALVFCTNICVMAQDDDNALYFTRDQMPDAMKWLPAPPDTMSPHFAYDIMQYMWGKTQRLDPERAAIAIRDAEWGISIVEKEFSEPFGMEISKANMPELYKLLDLSILTADEMGKGPKTYYMRRRPFMRMHEPTITPWDEKYLRTNGSYPSGHGIGDLRCIALERAFPQTAGESQGRVPQAQGGYGKG